MKNYRVLVDRGFRGVLPGDVGAWDENDPEVGKNAAAGFLAPLETETEKPAAAAGHSEDEDPAPAKPAKRS